MRVENTIWIYLPGSKCEALRLGVYLILLYFIRISLSTPKTFFLFGWWKVEGGRWTGSDFFGLQFSLYYYGEYFGHRSIYIGIYKCAHQICCGFNISNKLMSFLTFSKSHWWDNFFKIGFYLHGPRGYF